MGKHIETALHKQLGGQGQLLGLTLRLAFDLVAPVGQYRLTALTAALDEVVVHVGGASVDKPLTIRGNEWYDHASGKGGGPVSFVRSYYGLSYPEVVTMLLGGDAKITYPSAKERKPTPPKEFALPEKYENMRRVFAYLVNTRHIDSTVVPYFAKRDLLYEDAKHHNCVFVGWDEEGVPRHAHARSSNSFGKPFRINIEGSDPRYSFHHISTDDKLYVFEAPIDMLSYITMNPRDWREHSYVACCGTSIQPVLQTGAQMDCQKATVFLCLDNDKAGNMACSRMAEEFGKAGIQTVRLTPRLKDWNDDLVAQQRQEVKPSWPVLSICSPPYGNTQYRRETEKSREI